MIIEENPKAQVPAASSKTLNQAMHPQHTHQQNNTKNIPNLPFIHTNTFTKSHPSLALTNPGS
jgi:hypothetical protein